MKYKPSTIPQGYTKESIIKLIQKQPDYQGDIIGINFINRVYSENELINKIINEVYKVRTNRTYVKEISKKNNQPEQLWVYKLAVQYYLQQYGESIKSKR